MPNIQQSIPVVILAACVSVVCPARAAVAQADGDDLCTLPLRPITSPPPGMRFVPQLEVTQSVYAVRSPSEGGTPRGTSGRSRTIKSGAFPDYPPEHGFTYPVFVNGLAYGYVAFGDGFGDQTGLPLGNFDVQITFFEHFDTAAPPFGSGTLGTVRFNNLTPLWGFVQWLQNPVELSTPIEFPARTWAYEYQIFESGTSNLWGTTLNSTALTSADQIVPLGKGPGNEYTVGSGDPFYFGNSPAAQGSGNYGDLVAGAVGSAANERNIYLRLTADIPAPCPGVPTLNPSCFDPTLDCASGPASRTFLIRQGNVQFVHIFLPVGASLSGDTFLDITAQHSSDDIDPVMALYGQDGVLVTSDDNSGPGDASLLSFGRGRRAADGDGIDLDGRHGDLAAGSFYLAVAGSGVVFGPQAFYADATNAVGSGSVTITARHNLAETPCPLPPPVAPTAQSLGTLARGSSITRSISAAPLEVQWLTFTLDCSVNPSNSRNTFDVLTLPNGSLTVDTEVALFDASGNLLATNDDACGAFTHGGVSLLSFGGAGAPPRPVLPSCSAVGQTGDSLAPGTYFLALGVFESEFDSIGWQARSAANYATSFEVTLTTSQACRADFNGDGNLDPDDLGDYINCNFATPPCSLADFNADGSVDPDDLGDFINAYFGPCP